MTRKHQAVDLLRVDHSRLHDDVVRAREWLVELGLVEFRGVGADGQSLWGLTKLGEKAGKEILAAAIAQLTKTRS
jgi:hypothetical protein